MKAIKPKAKSKKSSGRFARVKFANKESADNSGPDLSQLRKPIDISVSSLLEVTKLLEIGGDEVKSMLAYECDVVYECRVCRSLFRSLANFISHKRVYCTENFNIALCRKIRNEHIVPTESLIPQEESADDKNKTKEEDNNRILRSQVVRKSSKKDLTSVLDMLQKKRSEDVNENLPELSSGIDGSNCPVKIETADCGLGSNETKQQVLLEAIDSTKTAVYQTVGAPTTVQPADLMKAQMTELQNMVDRGTAILNSDGCSIDASLIEKHDNPVQLYGSDDEGGISMEPQCTRDLVCSVCNAKFATRKTLTYHMKSLHVSYRTCYPCPCCDNTFANTWSVYRHLFKVHRKSNVQVRKLRSQIQEKAFRKETTGAEDIEKENARIKMSSVPDQQPSNNTQEWMEHLELDLELQRCGGCGRRFDRRAALISHSQFCQKRAAACSEATSATKSKRLSKTPSPNNVAETNDIMSKETTERTILNRAQTSKKKIPQKSNQQIAESNVDTSTPVTDEKPPDITHNSELSIRVENVSRISDADWEMIGNNSSRSPTDGTLSSNPDSLTDKEPTLLGNKGLSHITVPDSPEIIFTSIDKARTVAISFGSKKRRVSLINNSNELSNTLAESDSSAHSSPSKDKEAQTLDAMTLMENRIATIANLRKLQCLPCRRKFTSMTNLRRHMAVHIGWHRYRCRLCDFKCFVKCDCVAHCNKVHDAQNNRAVIADMVIHIPPDQSVLAKEIMMDLSNSQGSISVPELIDVSESSPKSIDITDGNGDSKGVEYPEDKSNAEEAPEGQVLGLVAEKEPLSNSISTEEQEDSGKKSRTEKNENEIQEKVEKDPDLRKIMEVIFGNAESDVMAGTESKEVFDVPPRVKSPNVADPDTPVKINAAKESLANNDNPKNRTTAVNAASKLEEIRPQRPTRNRVKPVHEDFIYDLTELIRKESAIHRAAALAAPKTLRKKQSNQQQATAVETEANGDAKSESESEVQKAITPNKMPGLLSLKKGESIAYNGKLSTLKQAEIKLNPLSEISISKSLGHVKIPVSNHK